MRSRSLLYISKVASLILLLSFTVASNLIFAFFLEWTQFSTCTGYIFNFFCEFNIKYQFDSFLYFFVILFFVISFFIADHIFKERSFYPFIKMIVLIIIILLIFDLIFKLPVKNLDKLYSSSYNVIDFMIILNFSIFIILNLSSMVTLLAAMIISFFVKFFSFFTLYIILSFIDGTLGTFFIFFTFSFGALTPHLMSLCMAFRSRGEQRV